MSAYDSAWCGRNEWVGSITDDQGDVYRWCHRHEDHVRSLLDELLDNPPEDD